MEESKAGENRATTTEFGDSQVAKTEEALVGSSFVPAGWLYLYMPDDHTWVVCT